MSLIRGVRSGRSLRPSEKRRFLPEELQGLSREIQWIDRPLVQSCRSRGTSVATRRAGGGQGMGGGLGVRWWFAPFLTAALLLSGAARAEDEEQATKLPRVYAGCSPTRPRTSGASTRGSST